jgi:hypothetical protein
LAQRLNDPSSSLQWLDLVTFNLYVEYRILHTFVAIKGIFTPNSKSIFSWTPRSICMILLRWMQKILKCPVLG